MSDFDAWIHHLLNNPDAAIRGEAARLLGENADALDDEQYSTALAALNQALADPDPMVLMTAMNAMSQFNRQAQEFEPETAEEETAPPIEAAVCRVCGKPEALVDPDECSYPNCPYK